MLVRDSYFSKLRFVLAFTTASALAACGGGSGNGAATLPNAVSSQPPGSTGGTNTGTTPALTVSMVAYPLSSAETIQDAVTAIDPTSGAFVFHSNIGVRRFFNATFSTIPLVPYPSAPPTLDTLGVQGAVGVDNHGTIYDAEAFLDTSPDCSPERCTLGDTVASPKSGPAIFIHESEQAFNPLYADATTDEQNRYWTVIDYIFNFNAPTLELIDLRKPAGSRVTTFSVGPTPSPAGSTIGTALARGASHVTWVATSQIPPHDDINRVSDSGAMTSFTIATGSNVHGMAVDDAGNVWFTETAHDKIGRITPNGAYVEYNLAPDASPTRITYGGDGAMWFIEPTRNIVARITASGHVDEFTLPAAGGEPVGISGPGHLAGCNQNLLYVAETDAIVTVTER